MQKQKLLFWLALALVLLHGSVSAQSTFATLTGSGASGEPRVVVFR